MFFNVHRLNVPFGQITGSRAREPVNSDVGIRMMMKPIGEVFSNIFGKPLIDPERKFEKALWSAIQGQSYDFSTNYKRIYYDKLDSEEQRQKIKATILKMLGS